MHVSSAFSRGSNDLLMNWNNESVCSWLQVQPDVLRFGTAWDPDSDFARSKMFKVACVFHNMYSRAVLVSTRNSLEQDVASRRT